jgi:DNA-binding protein HU-beta
MAKPKAAKKATKKPVAKKAAGTGNKPMTKGQLVACIAEASGLTKAQGAKIFDDLAAIAYKEAKRGVGFTIPGIGKLVLQKRQARMGRNPQTGEAIKIPARRVVKFRVAKACKDAILGAK